MTAPSEVLPVASVASMPDLIGEWRGLAASIPDSSYFQTPDWVIGWWETLAARPPTEVAIWREPSGELSAIVALSLGTDRFHPRLPIPLTRLVLAGSGVGAADHCGWLAAPGWEGAVVDWLLAQAFRRPLLLANTDPVCWPSMVSIGALPIEATQCPRLDLSAALSGLRESSRYKRVLRHQRSLIRKGVEFDYLENYGIDTAHFAELIRLHSVRREMVAGRSGFDIERLALHMHLVAHAGDQTGTWAVVARHDDRVIGMQYGFRWLHTWSAYQAGWDPDWASSSLGSVLIAHSIETASALGARVFDFLRGAESWKYDFLGEDRVDTTWLIGSGASARLILLKSRLRKRRGRRGR